MTKFSNKFKKPCFWPISRPFSQFSGQKNFPLSRKTSRGILAPCQNLEKMTQSPKKPGKTEGQINPILHDPFGYCWGSNNNLN